MDEHGGDGAGVGLDGCYLRRVVFFVGVFGVGVPRVIIYGSFFGLKWFSVFLLFIFFCLNLCLFQGSLLMCIDNTQVPEFVARKHQGLVGIWVHCHTVYSFGGKLDI